MAFTFYGGGGGGAAAETVDGVAGEAIALGQACYLSTITDGTRGKIYLADADDAGTSTNAALLGLCTSAAAGDGSAVTIQTGGLVETGLAGLTSGKVYGLSATAGALALTASAPWMGIAESASSLRLSGVYVSSGFTAGTAMGSDASGVLTAGLAESVGYAVSTTELQLRGRVGATQPSTVPWSGPTPLNYWRMNEGSGTSLGDDGTGSNTATLAGSAGVEFDWITGVTIGSLTSQTVIQTYPTGGSPPSTGGATATVSPDTTTFTYAAWVYPEAFTNQYMGIGKGDRLWGLATASTGSQYDIANFNVGGSYKASTNPLIINTWQLVAFVKDGTTLTMYLNGAANGVFTGLSAEKWDATTFYLARHSSGGLTWEGRMRDFATWSSALSGAQMLEMYNSGTPLDLA